MTIDATLDEDQPRTAASPWLTWLAFVVLCNLTGLVSAAFAGSEQQLYSALERPTFAPPSWVFAPVWAALYTLMGTATYLVWRRCRGARRRTAMLVFALQLALNAAWTPIFFGLGQIFAAFVVIIAYWLSVSALAFVYYRRVRLAGALIAPLWLWVSFAAVLNGAIWWLNR